jgi:hypothetical protein
MWNNVESTAKIELNRVVLTCEQSNEVIKAKGVTKTVAVDFDLMKPCSEKFHLDYKMGVMRACTTN